MDCSHGYTGNCHHPRIHGQLHASESEERGGYIHSIKQEELLFVSHQRVTPTASHLRYSNRVLLDEVHKNMEGRNYLYMHRMRMVV